MTIYFYTTVDAFGCFSNFSPHGFYLDGLYWKTVEHYFQAQKFFGTEYAEKIRRAKTPKLARDLGRTRTLALRSDWEESKESIMKKAMMAKFQNHGDIRKILLDTGTEVIMENSPFDHYWGIGHDGTGLNRLGHLLMEVRALLAKESM